MTSFDRFERSLPTLFDELAQPRVPDYTDDLLARTAATRQRPGWAFTERWLPMSALTRRFAAAPRIPWRMAALVALLAVAALITALVAGAFLTPKPAPYGPAVNGNIVFVDSGGSIVAGNPATGSTQTIVAGSGHGMPIVSPDGTQVAFTVQAEGAKVTLWRAPITGASPVQLTSAY